MGILATALSAAVIALPRPQATAQPFGYDQLTPIQKSRVSGLAAEAMGPPVTTAQRRAASAGAEQTDVPGCGGRRSGNITVNQGCLNVSDADMNGPAQAQNQPGVTVNPNNPKQMVASYNDFRRGQGTCGVSYSGDGGDHWADTTTPNAFVRGTAFGVARQYFQSSGDTSVDFDTRDNAYLLCQQFKRGTDVTNDPDRSSGIYVFRSTGSGGASFNFTGRPVIEHVDVAGTGGFLLNEPSMTVDDHAGSSWRDRVYVTWTALAADGTSYIYASSSNDYGEHFTDPVLVSSSSALCQNTMDIPTPQGKCNTNQFAKTVVASDGTLHVVWANYNTAREGDDNHFQTLAARSTDGGATFSAPVKVGNFHDLPDCVTYQGERKNPGSSCVPEKGTNTNSYFSAANYPVAAVAPNDPKKLVVTYGSYINRNSNEDKGCTPAGLTPAINGLYDGVKDGGCNNDIVISVSTNGGGSFTGASANVRDMPVVTDKAGQAKTDQFWQGTTFSPRGTLVTTYYDRQYGNDSTTGFSDITLTANRGVEHRRVTSSSMPPPTEFYGTFYGDSAMVAATDTKAYPVWSDTRAEALSLCPDTGRPGVPPKVCTLPPSGPQTIDKANDQDVMTAGLSIP
ncbi:hypothetical protein AB0I02_37070 [Streptomyces phaeochromogenes]